MATATIEEHDDVEHEEQSQPCTIKRVTPLPKFQLFLVLLVQFAEPITAIVIYPFINQFIRDTGITGGDERKTGYYGGIIESLFFFTEALTVLHWGQLSDHYGRRPILLTGPLGLTFAMLGFGLSSTFWPLVVYRSLQGIFNGNIGVAKTVMVELTDSTNIGDAFAFMPLMWSCGSTIAPAIGGVFTDPAERWPSTLGKIALLRQYPYFLPCFIAALISFSTFAISYVGMKESRTVHSALLGNVTRNSIESVSGSEQDTLISEHERRDYHTIHPPTLDSSLSTSPPSSLRSVLTRETIFLCINYSLLCFTDLANHALFPLILSTPIKFGGLGFDPYTIGVIMGVWGFVNATVQLALFGLLIRRYGPRTVYIFSYSSFFICILAYPVANFFAKQANKADTKVWIVIVVYLSFRILNAMSYGAFHILIIERSTSKATLGTLNGFVQMIGCVTKSIAPFVATSLFSLSLEKHIAGGNMVYYIFLIIILIGVQLGRMIPPKSPSLTE